MQNAAAAAQVGRQVYQGGKTLAKHGATAARHGATAAKATGAAAQTAGAATGTAATGGVAAAYFVGKAAVAGVKAVKNKRAAGKDVDQPAKSETKGKDTTATAAAIAAGQKGKDAAKSAVSTAIAAAASKVSGCPSLHWCAAAAPRSGSQAWNQEAGQQCTRLGCHSARSRRQRWEQRRRPPMSDGKLSASTAPAMVRRSCCRNRRSLPPAVRRRSRRRPVSPRRCLGFRRRQLARNRPSWYGLPDTSAG